MELLPDSMPSLLLLLITGSFLKLFIMGCLEGWNSETCFTIVGGSLRGESVGLIN